MKLNPTGSSGGGLGADSDGEKIGLRSFHLSSLFHSQQHHSAFELVANTMLASLGLSFRSGSAFSNNAGLIASSCCRWSSTATAFTTQRQTWMNPGRTKALTSRQKISHRTKILEDTKKQAEGRILEKFQHRDWRAGDLYSPHDLSPSEMRKWQKRWSPTTDAFDALNINPLDHYKNFSLMSEYVTTMGRIKARRLTGLRPVNQRKIAKAIRRSIALGLMPSVHRHPELLAIEARSRFGATGGGFELDISVSMSLTNAHIWAASPSTARGQPTQLSSDAKGERLAYASNKSIFLRSLDDPAVAKQYTEHKTQTTVARFSPSGFYVASGDASGTVRVWDCVGDGLTKGEYPIVSGRINDIAWDGDSQRIIAVGDGKQRYGHCFTWDSGNSVGEIYGHTQTINSVSIRQQRPLRAAAAGDDKTLVFYHGAPFKFNTGIRDKHVNYIYGVAFSPDGSHLVSVGGDRRIWLYDGKTGEAKGQIGEGEHKGSIFGVSWSRDSKKFVTASADKTVKIWDVEAGKATQTWTFGDDKVVSPLDQQVGVVWPPGRSDGLLVSLSLSGDLNYLVEGTPQPRQVLQGHQKSITALTRVNSGEGAETLWTGSFEGRVCSWDFASGTAETIDGDQHTGYISGLATTQEGKGRIYSVGWDDALRSADAGAKTYTGNSAKLSAQPKSIATSSETVLVAHSEGIDIYQDGQKSGSAKVPADVTTIAAQGTTAAVGSEDSTVRIGTVTSSTFTPSIEFKASRNPISALAFSPDSSLLAVGDSRGKIYVFNSKDGKLVTDRWSCHTARVTSIAWNSKGTHAVSGALDTSIFVWSLAKPGDWIQAANAHKEGVHGVSWIEDESKIASAGADAAVKIWKVEGLA
ncbi:WD repeat-containing protein 1 [Talaromyces islandicus]|uniref:Small ribosomal subunit protein bS18m n=1 Tax=Talaromyces islandicus TaxID=28573 RepID=A0A0U1LNF6_TALIS|nr:WD repeat-containing protein 1 [Talaromyces islandicus]